jgi:membrane protease YdiL (CAAX protease family)
MFTKALQKQLLAILRYPLTVCLIVLTCIGVGYLAYLHQQLPKAVAYLAAMWLCSFITDLLTTGRQPIELPVKAPRTESLIALLLTGLGILGLMLRFVWLDWSTTPGLLRIVIAALIFLCTFPVLLAIILLLRRYRPGELGFRFNRLVPVGIAALVITALTALTFAPSGFTYKALMQETGGVGGMLLTGFVMAALPEEFMRLVLQTRLGRWLNNRALGWFIACVLWALMHVPKWYSDGHDLKEALLGAVRIIPLGLMWSYLIHRTKNILPSIIAHGLNVWGLQNF